MGTDYSVLTSQTSGGIPGSTWANGVRANQEAFSHPPSARFWAQAHNAATYESEPTPLVASSYGKVNFTAPPHGSLRTPYTHSQAWQDDVESTTATTNPFIDTTNNTANTSGGFIDANLDTHVNCNSFQVPRAGIYLINANVGYSLVNTAGSMTVALALNGTRLEFAQVDNAGSGAGSTNLSISTVWDLATSDYFDVQCRPIGAGATIKQGSISIVRLSESADA